MAMSARKGNTRMSQESERIGHTGAILKIEDLSISFGGVSALKDVNLEVDKSEILALIGPNGAGKTCLLNCINHFYDPDSGSIVFKGTDLTALRPDQIARLGIARVFQTIQLFSGLTALDNLMAARHIHMKPRFLSETIYYGKAMAQEIRHREKVEEIIKFLEMESIRKTVVGALPYGKRKLVDLGRALAMEPQLLLLDEPMAGMNLEEKEDMARFIIDVFEEKRIPIILVEHDMDVIMDIADRIMVLDYGVKIAEGTPKEIKGDPKVIAVYLGEEAA